MSLSKAILRVLAFTSLLATAIGQEAHRPRIALMDFTCEDNSYRSTLAARDFTLSVQSILSTDNSHEWVERAELDTIEREFRLADLGALDRSESLRQGRWVKAGWGIFGRISPSTPDDRRTVTIEVIDLHRADILATSAVNIPQPPDRPFTPRTATIDAITTEIRSLLDAAGNAKRERDGLLTVGVLHINSAVRAWNSRPEPLDLETPFRDALSDTAEVDRSFHVLTFPRGEETLGEAGLVLSGLVEAGSSLWRTVADVYVWGECVLSRSQRRDDATGATLIQDSVVVDLTVWNGTDPPETRHLIFDFANDQDSIVRQMVAAVRPHLQHPESATPTVERLASIRMQLARELAEPPSAPAVYHNLRESTPRQRDERAQRDQWIRAVRRLETASFLAPDSAEIRRKWMRVRWDNVDTDTLRSPLLHERARAAAWRGFISEFGFDPHYINVVWDGYDMIRSYVWSSRDIGIPADVGASVLGRWKREFFDAFITAVSECPDESFPHDRSLGFLKAVINSVSTSGYKATSPQAFDNAVTRLWSSVLDQATTDHDDFTEYFRLSFRRAFELMGLAEHGEELLARLEPLRRQPVPEKREPSATPLELPRISSLDPAESGDLLDDGEVSFFPNPLPTPTPEARVPIDVSWTSVRAAEFHDGALWISATEKNDLPLSEEADRLEDAFKPIVRREGNLWCFIPQSGDLFRFPLPLPRDHVIEDLLSVGDELWLALGTNGVARWNPQTGNVTDVTSEGLIDAYKLEKAGSKVFAVGSQPGFATLSPESDNQWRFTTNALSDSRPTNGRIRRIAVSDQTVFSVERGFFSYDLETGAVTRWNDRFDSLSPFHSVQRTPCLAVDRNGAVWISGEDALIRMDPESGQLTADWRRQSTRIDAGGTVTGSERNTLDGVGRRKPKDKLIPLVGQRLSTRKTELGLRENDAFPLVAAQAGSRIEGEIIGIVPDGDLLWVIVNPAKGPFDWADYHARLFHTGERKWVGGFTFDRAPSEFVARDQSLWIVSHQYGGQVTRLDAAPLLATPRDQWLTEHASAGERFERRAHLPATSQAVVLLFEHDPEGAQRVLLEHESDGGELNSEALFILMLANDRHGLARPGQERHYREELLTRFPDGIYAETVRSWKTEAEIRAAAAERRRHAVPFERPRSMSTLDMIELIADFDMDADRQLDAAEFLLICDLEFSRLGLAEKIDSRIPRSELIDSVFRRSDSDDDSYLNIHELLGTRRHFRKLLERVDSAGAETDSPAPTVSR